MSLSLLVDSHLLVCLQCMHLGKISNKHKTLETSCVCAGTCLGISSSQSSFTVEQTRFELHERNKKLRLFS